MRIGNFDVDIVAPADLLRGRLFVITGVWIGSIFLPYLLLTWWIKMAKESGLVEFSLTTLQLMLQSRDCFTQVKIYFSSHLDEL